MNALLKTLVNSLAGLLLGMALLPEVALAQVPDRVGRIAYLAGDVQFYSESAQAWLPAQLNAPVSSRNSLFTGADGRAEVRFGSTAVTLDRQTQLDIQVLDDARFKAGVPRGSISLRVGQIERDESYEVLAPAATYGILQAGRFRVDAADGGSSVTVLAGLVNASVAGGSSVMVEAGQALSAANGNFQRGPARSNALDNWAAQRDDANRSSQSARYVSPNMTGYEELDANGRWASDPDYGNVWYPTTYVTPGWVPYRDGRWAYVAPWGWTWIDAAPWGFAPFHYGRWVLIGARWGWMPGAYVRRPSYAPALVGFIGGSNVAISISIGTQPAVGWYPLPPWERYRPAYGYRDNHLRNINNFNISKPPANAWRMVEHKRVSANQVQGATVVPREAFVDSRPVRRAVLPVAAPVLAAPMATTPLSAPVAHGSAGVRPDAGDRHGAREPDQERAVRGQRSPGVNGGAALPSRTTEALPVSPAVPQPMPGNAGSGPRIYRSESRGVEHQTPPAIAVPQTGQQVPTPRIDSTQPRQAVPPPMPSPDAGAARRDGGQRSYTPAVAEPAPQARPPMSPPEGAAPRQRVEAPAIRTEPRIEQRIAPRAEPRVEQRSEPRPEPRQMQRAEPPPQPRPATAQPEQKRAAEPERERRPQGERGREG